MDTLAAGTRRFELKEPAVSNAELAERLGLTNQDADPMGYPSCIFTRDGHVAAIRMSREVIGVFHLFQDVAHAIVSNRFGTPTDRFTKFG
jgi:hypothetical protein